MTLYCICRSADETRQMIECEKCNEWFHFDCVGVDPVSDENSILLVENLRHGGI
jgi:hypothetical protein